MNCPEKLEKSNAVHDIPATDTATLRTLDASFNRAQEGIRVVEDYARMVMDDRFLSSQLKQLRHDLTVACNPIDIVGRVQSRESEVDVGRHSQTESEYQREDSLSLLRSNMSRVQQAVRTIEEFSKLAFPTVVAAVEQIRYRAYTIEKAILNTTYNVKRLQEASLYVLVDACGETGPDFPRLESLVADLVAAEVGLIQLRDKTLTDAAIVAAGKAVGAITRHSKTLWIMNDRIDLAVAANADGVHLGQDDLSVHAARQMLRAGKLVGLSTHNICQAREAVMLGADYIGVGPVFPSKTKSFDQFPGVEFVKEIVSEITLPAFAIGGIDSENVHRLTESGCRRVAVSSAVSKASDPVAAARSLIGKLAQH
jgi:thiamine-phosphate pyrophosphorylase